jgi:ribosomal protein L11 methyltransferase
VGSGFSRIIGSRLIQQLSKWPAVDVTHTGDSDLTLAIVDDFAPTAVEPRDDNVRIFFSTATTRDAACAALNAARYRAEAVDVDDEDWAKRSQEDLKPVTIERITVAPPWYPQPPAPSPEPLGPSPQPLFLVIQPSMGFGTGHHATTRLCLRALQAMDLTSRFLLDVGTGSGILAIAAVKLGAARAEGIDYDADAIAAANENLQLNSGVESVEFRVADLSIAALPAADVVTANLTGAALIGSAARLLDLVCPGGTLIVSGLLDEERADVVSTFAGPDDDAGPNKVRPTPEKVRPTPEKVRPTPEKVRPTPEKVRPTPEKVGPTPEKVGPTPEKVGPTPEKVRPTPSEVGRTLSGPPLFVIWEQHEDGWVALAMKRS